MQLKLIPLLAATVAIALAGVPTNSVRAEVSQPLQAAANEESDLLELTHSLLLYNVELNPQQEEILNPTIDQALGQVKSLLNPDQVETFHRTIDDGEGLAVAIERMEMSSVQEVQVRNVLQAASLQVAPILTPQQRSQIEQNLEEHLGEDL